MRDSSQSFGKDELDKQILKVLVRIGVKWSLSELSMDGERPDSDLALLLRFFMVLYTSD